ncbi:MAG: hypothetical protein HZA15_15505 [Nitrospirae bacterium]|nr:hypothetical protein [Nitrospirota bacterium]
MTADQVAAITAIAAIFKQIGTWPIGTVFMVVMVGPWIVMVIVAWLQEKRFVSLANGHEKRFEAVVKMYEANVQLVKGYDAIAKNLQDLVIMATQTMTQVSDSVTHNLFCPLVRHKAKPRDIEIEGDK